MELWALEQFWLHKVKILHPPLLHVWLKAEGDTRKWGREAQPGIFMPMAWWYIPGHSKAHLKSLMLRFPESFFSSKCLVLMYLFISWFTICYFCKTRGTLFNRIFFIAILRFEEQPQRCLEAKCWYWNHWDFDLLWRQKDNESWTDFDKWDGAGRPILEIFSEAEEEGIWRLWEMRMLEQVSNMTPAPPSPDCILPRRSRG